MKKIKDYMAHTITIIDDNQSSSGGIKGVSTGFTEFDKITSGLYQGQLIVIGGCSSMGTSIFAMNIIENVALLSKKYVCVFSLDMTANSLIQRMLSSIGEIDQNKMRTGCLNNDELNRLTNASILLSQSNIMIDDSSIITTKDIQKKIEMLNIIYDIELVVIDFLQLIKPVFISESCDSYISEIMKELKLIAKKLNLILIVLSDVKVEVESRLNKRPMLTDLNSEGMVSKYADLVLFVYRDIIYNYELTDKDTAEIIIEKYRYGITGNFKLRFIGCYCKFENNDSVQ